MNLHTIKNIQRLQSNPSVTLTLPTNRTYPDNEKDAIRLKNLVNEAISRLEKDFGKLRTGRASICASPKLTAPACSGLLPESGPSRRAMSSLLPPSAA